MVKTLEYMISLGLVLFPIENHLFNIGSIKLKFIAMALIGCGSFIALLQSNKLGRKSVVVALVIIAFFIVVSSQLHSTGFMQFYNIILAIMFVFIYLIGVNSNVTKLFKYAILIEAISCIVLSIYCEPAYNPNLNRLEYFSAGILANLGWIQGSPMSTNYNLASGYMCFLLLFVEKRWQRYLVPVVVLAIYFTNSLVGVLFIGLIFVITIVSKNYDKYSMVMYIIFSMFMVIWFFYGDGHLVWARIIPDGSFTRDIANSHEITNKIAGYKYFIDNFNFFGTGYDQMAGYYYKQVVHNTPLVTIQQIGVIAGIAWLYASIKSFKIGMLWIVLGVMCLIEHNIWTTLSPYWWLAIGISNKEVHDQYSRTRKDWLAT